ncbi:MAG: 3-oxoacid CoA-transferase subunit B [Gammaproteobacteria bacterium]
MAWRCAQDIPDGAYVNLGIGIPEMVAAHVPDGREVVYHTENGLLGFGPAPPPEARDPDLINAGKKPVSVLPGAAFFHQADSFAMIRGGHVDFSILGAMQIGANGDIANWSTGASGAIPAVGGAMDLVAGVPNVIALTEHTTRDGQPKLLERCTYPLTGAGVVTRVYTNLGVVDITHGCFVLQEIAPGVDVETVRSLTAGRLLVAEDLREIRVS